VGTAATAINRIDTAAAYSLDGPLYREAGEGRGEVCDSVLVPYGMHDAKQVEREKPYANPDRGEP
jgi:hypothetical protein